MTSSVDSPEFEKFVRETVKETVKKSLAESDFPDRKIPDNRNVIAVLAIAALLGLYIVVAEMLIIDLIIFLPILKGISGALRTDFPTTFLVASASAPAAIFAWYWRTTNKFFELETMKHKLQDSRRRLAMDTGYEMTKIAVSMNQLEKKEEELNEAENILEQTAKEAESLEGWLAAEREELEANQNRVHSDRLRNQSQEEELTKKIEQFESEEGARIARIAELDKAVSEKERERTRKESKVALVERDIARREKKLAEIRASMKTEKESLESLKKTNANQKSKTEIAQSGSMRRREGSPHTANENATLVVRQDDQIQLSRRHQTAERKIESILKRELKLSKPDSEVVMSSFRDAILSCQQ